MYYVKAPDINPYSEGSPSVFLAGGGDNNSRPVLIDRIKSLNIVVLDPWREDYHYNIFEQTMWEHQNMFKSSLISFWFGRETLCPIALFELGKNLMIDKPVVIGVDSKYKRRQDVEIQTGLIHPEIKIVYSLNELSDQIISYFKEGV